MFTGIIEQLGTVKSVSEHGSGKTFRLSSLLAPELKADQSLCHNGACLTVEQVTGDTYQVTAVYETLLKTNLGEWKPGDSVNLERSIQMNGRFEGHIVQGHVDATARCIEKKELDGSWEYTFEFPAKFHSLIIEKGSVSLNGISLTVFDVTQNSFRVAIIPYTYDNTNMRAVTPGNMVNIEFDVIGKYVQRIAGVK